MKKKKRGMGVHVKVDHISGKADVRSDPESIDLDVALVMLRTFKLLFEKDAYLAKVHADYVERVSASMFSPDPSEREKLSPSAQEIAALNLFVECNEIAIKEHVKLDTKNKQQVMVRFVEAEDALANYKHPLVSNLLDNTRVASFMNMNPEYRRESAE